MKKLFALLAFALLASCIDVEDMSDSWDKGSMNPALEGTWKMNFNNDHWRFEKHGDSYILTQLDKNNAPKDGATLARTIDAGHYHFLLLKEFADKNGSIIRFDVKDGNATQYGFNDIKPIIEWFGAHYPNQRGITLQKGGNGSDISLKVRVLDAESLAILAEIPEQYWSVTAKYTKK